MAALAPEMQQTSMTPVITLSEAQDIVAEYEGNEVSVTSLVEVGNVGFSYTASRRVYDITLTNPSAHYLLLTSPLHSDSKHDSSPTITITLQEISALLTKVTSCTNVPVPKPIAQDITGSKGRWGFGWLLLLVPQSLQVPTGMSTSIASLASLRPTLSPRQLARVELRLGTYLRAIHGITNESFGRPVESTMDQSTPALFPSFLHTISEGEQVEEDWSKYSWQDTFVLMLDELIAELCEPGGGPTHFGLREELGIDVEELRRYLSRAIGAFLFDDVESPGLIWVTGSEVDVLVSLSQEEGTEIEDGQGAEADIAYLLPTFSHALWGDPLMEAWFMPPGPSQAINEGYFGGEGSLIVFPRQKTKRVWYTIYLALLVLVEERRGGRETTGQEGGSSKVQWAREVLPKCVKALKDAPCY
ncbi:hypothetical protein EDC04DRAFT_318099 [Pisolithus marmoratus]|nr:hypothetical protein EDC04DRAFT_318099 [Pisolithus marmoratus]